MSCGSPPANEAKEFAGGESIGHLEVQRNMLPFVSEISCQTVWPPFSSARRCKQQGVAEDAFVERLHGSLRFRRGMARNAYLNQHACRTVAQTKSLRACCFFVLPSLNHSCVLSPKSSSLQNLPGFSPAQSVCASTPRINWLHLHSASALCKGMPAMSRLRPHWT